MKVVFLNPPFKRFYNRVVRWQAVTNQGALDILSGTSVGRFIRSLNMDNHHIMTPKRLQSAAYLSGMVVIQAIGYPLYVQDVHSQHTGQATEQVDP